MKLSLFLIVLLGLVAASLVNGHCVRKDDSAVAVLGINGTAAEMESVESEEEGGVKKFFKTLGCEIVDAGRTVKESVKTGYQYVKNKLRSNKDKEVEAEVLPIPNPEQQPENEFNIDVRMLATETSSAKP